MTAIITANPHDAGFDLVAGTDVTGPKVGRIYWDAADSDAGLVLLLNGEQHLPDDIDSAVAILDEEGYKLTDASRADIAGLVSRYEDMTEIHRWQTASELDQVQLEHTNLFRAAGDLLRILDKVKAGESVSEFDWLIVDQSREFYRDASRGLVSRADALSARASEESEN